MEWAVKTVGMISCMAESRNSRKESKISMYVLAEFLLTTKLLLAAYQTLHTVINNCSLYFTKQKAH